MDENKNQSFVDNNFHGGVARFHTWSQFELMDMACYHTVFFIFKIWEDGKEWKVVGVKIIFYTQ